MNHAMTDGINLLECRQRGAGNRSKHIQDSPDGLVVPANAKLFPDLRLPLASQNQPSRPGRPINAALGQNLLGLGFKEAEFEAAGPRVANQ